MKTVVSDVQCTSDRNKRILSGMRPTGKLHLGHLHGALENWRELQNRYECFYFVADWHALTTDYSDPSGILEATFEMLADWIACGVDPGKATIFIQSHIKEHAELALLLAMITPLSWLERVPTYKEMKEELRDKDLATYGFLGYPLLQTADIIAYKANYVPVGEDQVPHLELGREIVRRFNYLYGDTFPEPQPLLTKIPKILGTDGRKMSKSYGNAIYLSDTPAEITEKIMKMYTDPNRLRRSDPGNPDVCGIFYLHKYYSSEDDISMVNRECRTAGIGCVDCKKLLLPSLIKELTPIRKKREELMGEKRELEVIIQGGDKKAREVAKETLEEVRKKVGLN
ncbi:MAG: tryptophan--tRNA ligase [Thermodesulfobacteriota bacterium]